MQLEDNGGTANGGDDTSTPQSVTITVAPVNDAPSFSIANHTSTEDAGAQSVANSATGISPGPADEAGQALTFSIASNTNPSLFSVAPAVSTSGTLTYTAAPNANGTATVSFTLHDDGGTGSGGADTSAPQSVTINVTPVNDAPSFASVNHTSAEDAGPQSVANVVTSISAGPADEAGQALAFSIVGNTNPSLFSIAPAVSLDGTLTYTATPNAHGSATITLLLQDDGGTADGGVTATVQSFTITVSAVNDAPSFTGGVNQQSGEDAGAQIVPNWASDISAGPVDEAGQMLTSVVTANTNPSLFSVAPAVSSTGTLTYTAAPNAHGIALVSIALEDDGGTADGGIDTSAAHTVTITVVDDLAVVLQKTLMTAPANLDMPESYRLRISVPNSPGVVNLTSIGPVIDILPTGTVFNGATPAADCQPGCIGTTPATVTWTSPCAVPLTPGTSCDIFVNVTFPSATYPSGTSVTNSFSADGTPAGEGPQSLGVGQVTHTVTTFVPAPSAALQTDLTAGSPNPPALDQSFSYELIVGNNGNVPLDNLRIVDTLPVEMHLDSLTTGVYTGLSDFAPGVGVRVTYEKNTAPGVFTLWGASPNTTTNTTLTAPPPGLGAGEYITHVRWEYGQAQPGMTASTRPRINGRITNPDNTGGPVAIGDTIQNCVGLVAVYTAGPTNVAASDCAAFVVGGSFFR
jgi:uncharacterized repeat protein (TIGR01451 family)